MKLSLMKTHGGKGTAQMLKWIIGHFPPNYQQMWYIDGCGGAASILLNKERSIFEVYNDLDWNTYNVLVHAFEGKLFSTHSVEYKEKNFKDYLDGHSWAFYNSSPSDWYKAEREYVLRNMSRGGLKKDFAWSDRWRGGQPGDVNAWINKVNQLPRIKQRLKDVEFHNEDVIDCLRKFNQPHAFTYLDPPYIHYTRVTKNAYNHEMSQQKHEELVDFLTNEWKGLFLLSGYANLIYAKLRTWTLFKSVANNSGQTKKKNKRMEGLWANYQI